MKKAVSISILLAFIVFLTFPFFQLFNYSQTSAADNSIAYDMPYPGMLPDHPLYILKVGRDRILEFFTRDNIKKARLYLLYSDKRIVMAQELAKKGKTNLAISTISKAEKYFLQIPQLLRDSKTQGVTPPDDLKLRLKLSNAKHKEMIDNIQRDLPQGETDNIENQLNLNSQIRKELEKL